MPDQSDSRTSTSTSTISIVDRTDTRPATRRDAAHDLDVRQAVRSVAGMAAGQSLTPGQPDSDTAWLDGRRHTGWSDRSLVIFGGGMGIVALIVLVVSVFMVSDDSTHPARSSVAPSVTAPPTAPSPTAVTPTPTIAPPPMPVAPTSSAQPAATAPSEPAAPPVPARVGPRRLHHLFPHLFPPD
jgi:hypothetical protein